jgi:trk system potassium uptake protein TrkH
MAVPAAYGFAAGEPEALSIAIAAAVTIACGICLRAVCRPKPLTVKDSFGVVSFGWIFASLFGALPFYLARPETGIVNCVFETISGITTTGATIFTQVHPAGHPLEGYFVLPWCVLLWRSMIQWIGGMGVIMMVIVLLPFLEASGLQILRAEVTVISQKIRPKMRDTGIVLAGIYVLLTAAEALLLQLAGMPLFDSVCHAFTTLSTGGFSPMGGSIEAYSSLWIEIIVLVFMFAGAASFMLHFRFIRGEVGSYFRSSEIRLLLGIVLVFAAASTLNRVLADPTLAFGEAVREGVFMGLSITTTTGYTNVQYGAWPHLSLIVLVLLMFAGGCVGSTGGSIKMRRLLILFKLVLREMKKVLYPSRVLKIKMDGEVVDEPVVRKVMAFLFLWLILFLIMTLVLAAYGHDLETSLSGAASCLGNVGPALGNVASDYASLGAVEKIVLMLGMLIGRLEIFSILVLFSPSLWRRVARPTDIIPPA